MGGLGVQRGCRLCFAQCCLRSVVSVCTAHPTVCRQGEQEYCRARSRTYLPLHIFNSSKNSSTSGIIADWAGESKRQFRISYLGFQIYYVTCGMWNVPPGQAYCVLRSAWCVVRAADCGLRGNPASRGASLRQVWFCLGCLSYLVCRLLLLKKK